MFSANEMLHFVLIANKAHGNKNTTSQSLVLRSPLRDRQLRNTTRAENYFQFQVQSTDISAHDIFFYRKTVPGESSEIIYLERNKKIPPKPALLSVPKICLLS